MRTRRRALLAVAGAAALLAVTSVLIAARMGFVHNASLKGPGVSSFSGLNLIALPYQNSLMGNSGDPMTAGTLLSDINGGPCVGTDAISVQKHLKHSDALIHYNGCSGRDFVLEPGEAYFLIMRGDFSYRIVGTHDPFHELTFYAAGPDSMSGTNFYAPPYHATASTASDLFRELGTAVQNVLRFHTQTDTYQVYTFGAPDFDLKVGEGVLVKVTSDITYSPRHY